MNVTLGRTKPARLGRGVALAVLMCSAAFAGACRGNTQEEMAAEPVEPTYVRVENRAYLDMTVYVYRSSQRTRLGTVTGNSSTKFIIPHSLLFGPTPLRFQADPIGGNRKPVSEEISVSPGDEVVLVIPPT